MFSVRPVFHALTASETAHVPDPPEPELDALGEADGEADGDWDGDGEVLAVGVGVGVPPLPPSRPKKWIAYAAMPVSGRT